MKRLLAVAVVLASTASVAAADPIASTSFGTLCGPSSGGQVCVTGSAELYAGMLKVSVQNAQGPAGDFVTNGTLHRVTGFGLYYTGATMGPMGALNTSTAPDGGWKNGVMNDLKNPGPNGSGWMWLLGAQVQGKGGTWGCDDPTGNNADVSSCNGPLFFEFTGIDHEKVRLDDLGFAFRSQSIGTNDASYKCYSTNGAGSKNPCITTTTTTVTPEPATFALLGTGILMLGGMGIVRRRRNGST